MKKFLHKHRLDVALVIICIVDAFAMSTFPSLCSIATGAILVGMVMDHRRQEADRY